MHHIDHAVMTTTPSVDHVVVRLASLLHGTDVWTVGDTSGGVA